MDNRDKAALQQLLDDYNQIVKNEFWYEFLEYVRDEAQRTLESLAKEEYNEAKLRYWQGAYKALRLVSESYPDRLYKEIMREIDK